MAYELRVPRINNNDDTVTLRTVCVTDLSQVTAGTVVAVVEDSKAACDVQVEASGYIRWCAQVGNQCRVGNVLALVFEDAESARGATIEPNLTSRDRPSPGEPRYTLTEVAQKLVDERGITTEELASLGAPVIRSEDVLALIAKRSEAHPQQTKTLSKLQVAIGRVVAQSHTNIPQAFLVVRVTCDALLERLGRRPLGLSEVLLKLTADLRAKFPEFFATLQGQDTLLLHGPSVNIGVTIDLGHGLFIPTVRDVAAMTLDQVGESLKTARQKAMAGTFQGDDLTGAHFSLSLNMAPDVVLSVPMIPPGQTAMLVIAGLLDEVHSDEAGQMKSRRYTNLGLAYDHRVINGAYALQFLQAIKRRVESPKTLSWLT